MKIFKVKNLITGLAISLGSLVAVPLLTANQMYLSPVENDFIESIINKLNTFYAAMPEDRVYLQTDKTLYRPGETIWLSSYVLDGKTLKPSAISEILHVELLSPSGNTFKSFKLINKKGRSSTGIDLSKQVAGGQYTLKAFTNWQKNEKDTTYFTKTITVQKSVLPKIKMSLDFQRESFGPGDVCMAKIELEDNTNTVLSNYDFEYQVKIKNKEKIREQVKTGNDGAMYIEFTLPKNLKTSDVLVTALIPYQNQTESISRAVPVVLNDIKIEFFPEGGDLVYNLPTNVAFRAFNEHGKPVDVEGIVYDSNDKEISTFKSFHFGMGAFALTPQSNAGYYAKIIKPVSIKQKFELPEILGAGYVMNLENDKHDLAVTIQSSVSETLHLVMQTRGKVIFTSEYKVNPGENYFNIATKDLPIGVSQLTIFDNYGIARAERLVFLNQENQLNLNITADKDKYTPREKVTLSIKATDNRGIPVPASLSLAVVNDQVLSFADDKQGNILSQLLLEQDLVQPVYEPSFYFDKDEPKASQALDYLLMTSGWRRFTWKELLDDNLPIAIHQGEKAMISGTVLNARKRPVANASIKVLKSKHQVKTDDDGKFIIKKIELDKVQTLQVSATNLPTRQFTINEYKQDYEFVLSPVYAQKNMLFNMDGAQIQEMVQMGAVRAKAPVPAVAEEPMEEELEMAALPVDDDMAIDEVNANEAQDIMEEDKELLFEDVMIVADERLKKDRVFEPAMNKREAKKVLYERQREFSAPVYENTSNKLKREDFRTTIFWDGLLELDRTGKTELTFYTSDEITSFRAIVEGTSASGEVGHAETLIYNQLPVSISVKVPNQVITSDIVHIPVTFTNNKDKAISGTINFTHPVGCKSYHADTKTLHLAPGQSKTVYAKYTAIEKNDSAVFAVKFKGSGFMDQIVKSFEIIPKGFPAQVSYSAQDLNNVYTINLQHIVKGSLDARLTAYPSVVSDLLSGVESILREPSGCFEQTSMSSYPNILVMDYLKTIEHDDKKVMARASSLLDKGYNKLITFETSKKGYDWFGRAPANEALTAYGLMQFNDMKDVYSPDQGMIDRTAQWLMTRRTGKGGFKKHNSAADSYGRASEDITNAYIVYALTEAGYKAIDKEIDHSYKIALEQDDPYQLAMLANTMFKSNDAKRAEKLLEALLKHQNEDGSFTGKTHSITRSQGKSLSIETTSMALMAMLKEDANYRAEINKAVDWLVKQRSGYGAFGNTQGTILALKALTNYAKTSKKIADSGTIEIWVDGNVVERKDFKAGSQDAIVITGLEKYLREGNNRVRVKFKDTDNALPYTLSANWQTDLPQSAKACEVKLDVNLVGSKVNVGETARLNVKVSNRTDKGLASPIAIVGIPAGLSLQNWQLKEMQEKGLFDYYEISDNNIILYLRQLAPAECKEYDFDLKAEIAGKYASAASCAYLYYTNEYKNWTSVKPIWIESSNK